MQCRYEYVLFDLDGTISESAPGIRRCIELTLQKMNKPAVDLSDYSKYIGPPLTDTFMRLCGLTGQEAKQALGIYLDLYDTEGEPRNRVYDGLGEVVSLIGESGAKSAVCSSKNQRSVEKVCSYLKISDWFDALCGSDLSGMRKEKEQIIPYTLSVLGGSDPRKAVMIGDTNYDARGARLSGVNFIGVTYGYGSRESMESEGACNFVSKPSELKKLLFH